MSSLIKNIDEAAQAVRRYWGEQAEVGIILGTGLGGLVEQIEVEAAIPYGEIPHFPEATVVTHTGQLVCGRLGGKRVVTMEGRFHYYEGHSMQEVTFPVRVMRALGAGTLLASCACGAMNPHYDLADIVLVEDHINLMGDNPLIGPNDEQLGPRFPDMSRPYDRELLARSQRLALEMGIPAHRGVYVAVAGPNLETRAEYRFLRAMGADVVGMSTVPEVLVAVHGGMRVAAFAVVTDMCLPDALEPADIESIIATAGRGAQQLARLIPRLLEAT